MISFFFMSLAIAEPSEQEEVPPTKEETDATKEDTEATKEDTEATKEDTEATKEDTEATKEEQPPFEEPAILPPSEPSIEEESQPSSESKDEGSIPSDTTEDQTPKEEAGTDRPQEKPVIEEKDLSTKEENSPAKEPLKPSIDLSNAEELGDLKKKQLMWLRPLPERFEQNPYLHVDFTSYCLEWGEFQVGLNTLKAGVLPRTQVGTSVPMWLIGLQNFDAKVNLLRVGAFDLALEGNSISLPTPDFRMSLTGGGLSTSIRVLEPWTIHLGTQYMAFSAKGLPDLDKISPFILQMSGVDVDSYRDELAADGVGFDINADVVTLRMATDIRINRRDSWIIQAQGIIWHSINSSSNLNDSDQIPKFLNADEIFALESEGLSDITKSYVVSVAHQWSWNHSYLRVGAGWSSMSEYSFAPAIIQSIDYAWRFGGKSKNREGKIRKGWKENKKKTDQSSPQKPPIRQ